MLSNSAYTNINNCSENSQNQELYSEIYAEVLWVFSAVIPKLILPMMEQLLSFYTNIWLRASFTPGKK